MDRVKKINKVIMLLLMISIIICMVVIGQELNKNIANASSTYDSYHLTFSYTVNKHFKKEVTVDQQGNRILGANIPEEDNQIMYNTYIVGTIIDGDSLDKRIVNDRDYLKVNKMSFSIKTNYPNVRSSVLDANGAVVARGGVDITCDNLADGRYELVFNMTGNEWKETWFDKAHYETVVSGVFNIDRTGPVISGLPTEREDNYKNNRISIKATDNLSGVDHYYVTEPNKGMSLYNSYSITERSTAGVYEFIAVDAAGNESDIYYYEYDNEDPYILFLKPNNEDILGNITNESIKAVGNDIHSGVKSFMVKRPNKPEFESISSGEIIASNSPNGEYIFKCEDKLGYMVQRSIILDTSKPKGIIYAGSDSLKSGSTTNASSIRFVGLDDRGDENLKYFYKMENGEYAPYTKGTELTSEGKYYLYVQDEAGNLSPEYNVIIDRNAPVLSSTVDFGMTTGDVFTVNAQKEGADLYVKEPHEIDYIVAPNKTYSVTSDSPLGVYYFYAKDMAGNSTEEQWVSYQGGKPEGKIVFDDNKNTVQVIWDDESWIGTINGEPYQNGTIIDIEGNYVVEITAPNGKSNSYSFSINHKYVVSQVVKPTCKREGYTEYKCITCGKTFQAEVTPIIPHDYKERIKEATCMSKGYKERYCTMCGESVILEEYEKLDHDYEEIVIEMTCTRDGCHRHKCKVCGTYYDTDIIEAPGHNYKSQLLKRATCTEDGKRHFICLTCGDEYDQTIKALGHRYKIESEEEKDGIVIRKYVCEECGDVYYQEIGKHNQKVADYVEVVFLKYQPYMWWTLLATTSLWSIAIGVTLVIAHKEEDKAKFRKMLINYGIGLLVIAAIVVACPYLIRGIASVI